MTTCHVPREVAREIKSRVRGQVVIHTDGVPQLDTEVGAFADSGGVYVTHRSCAVVKLTRGGALALAAELIRVAS